MTKTNLKAFTTSVNEFDRKEKRTGFFKLAKNLVDKGFETEGMLLILSTWNFAIFRYAVKTFDIDELTSTIAALEINFKKFDGQDFQTINLDNYENEIKTIYDNLSTIKGIEHTGAPKLMHLKYPQVFVMWDTYIRGNKPKKLYKRLDNSKSEILGFKKYQSNSNGYFEFLKDMQVKFKHLSLKGDKTLAKAIDEFNYINITLTLQDIECKNRKHKKEK